MNGSTRNRTIRALGAALLAGGLLLAGPAQLQGQVGVASQACPGGLEPIGTVGISSLECTNCRLYTTVDERVWNFSSEPIVRAVKPGSPADGKIHEGDAIVAIDGHLITTGEGGRRLGNLQPGQAVSVVVRRGNREKTVDITPGSECPSPGAYAAAPAAAAVPAPEAPPAEPTVSVGVAVVPRAAVAPRPVPPPSRHAGVSAGPVPRSPYTLLPSGWFGFGIQCTNCRWSVEEDTGKSEWRFSAPPEISSVEDGSPAAAAGLRRGDVLLQIDGEPLVSREGGRRFGSVEPGEEVQWTYVRNNETRTTTAIAGRRLDTAAPLPAPDAAPAGYSRARSYSPAGTHKLRYSGLVGEASVEVRGTGSVVVNVIEPGREIEIVTSDSRTRIRLDDSK